MLTLTQKIAVVVLSVVFAFVMLAGAAYVLQPMSAAIHAQSNQ